MADYNRTTASTISGVNAELQKVAAAIASKVDETGGSLLSAMNANGQRILNLPIPVSSGEPVPFGMAIGILDQAQAAADRAEDEADRSQAQADRATSEANRAESYADDFQVSLQPAKDQALLEIAADVAAVDASRVSAQALISADVAQIDASRINAQNQMAVIVGDVVDARNDAQSVIDANVSNVRAIADYAAYVEIPAQVNRLGLQYPPIPYSAGLLLDSHTKTYSKDGFLYIWAGLLGTTSNGLFTEVGWQPLQGDVKLRQDVEQGTSLIQDVKHVASVAALKLLVGSYPGQVVQLVSYYADTSSGGGSLKWDSLSVVPEDDGLVFKPSSVTTGRWVRCSYGNITPDMFGARGSSDSASVQRWLQACCNGVPGSAAGHYSLEAPVLASLNASASIECSATSTFTAAGGFPQNKMIRINTGSGANHVFKWNGGQLYGANIPNSLPGQANDMLYFSAENCSRCDIVLDKTVSGDSFIGAGSDSHLFIAGARNVRAYIGEAIGAVDAAIYVSSDFTGTIGNTLEAGGNFSKCITSIIVKRDFEQISILANLYDCVNGVGTGLADIATAPSVQGGSGMYVEVNAFRTERPAFFQGGSGGVVSVNAQELGVSVPGYTSTQSKGCYLSGSSNMTVTLNVNGVNPSCTVNSGFIGVDCDDRVINGSAVSAIGNRVVVNSNGVGRSFLESGGANGNLFIVSESNMVAGSVTLGSGSSQHRTRRSAAEGFSIDEALISLGGLRGAESLRVIRGAGQVNYLQIVGSLAAAASGVVISSQGADVNTSISINPKGTGIIFLGGTAGTDALRVQKGQANGFEVQSSASGSAPVLAARGSDPDVDYKTAPKGAGKYLRVLGNIPDAASDAAAAVLGVPVGGEYRTGSSLKVRTS